uniref:Uncharacterized protein n=1 Tax=Romanomermis culicivorax TaxID=13658 RepID=A0A915JPD0_ROMCU
MIGVGVRCNVNFCIKCVVEKHDFTHSICTWVQIGEPESRASDGLDDVLVDHLTLVWREHFDFLPRHLKGEKAISLGLGIQLHV